MLPTLFIRDDMAHEDPIPSIMLGGGEYLLREFCALRMFMISAFVGMLPPVDAKYEEAACFGM